MELSVSRRSCTSILPCRVRQCLLLAVKWKPLPKVEMSTENSLMRVRFCTTNANVPLHSGILPIWGDSRIQVQAALRIVLAYIKLYASSQAQIALRLARAWRSCIGKHFHPSTAWWEITLQELLFIFWIVRNQEQRIVPFRDLIEAVKRVFFNILFKIFLFFCIILCMVRNQDQRMVIFGDIAEEIVEEFLYILCMVESSTKEWSHVNI